MKVDAEIRYPLASQRAQARTADHSSATSFSAALATKASTPKTNPVGVAQANFTSMTRQELRDWVNGKIRSGEMSLDDGRPFMAMTMKIPVSGGYGGEVDAAGDSQRIDFTEKVRAGIEGARLRNDETSMKMLESALSIIKRYQG